jgi:hypothetical protein
LTRFNRNLALLRQTDTRNDPITYCPPHCRRSPPRPGVFAKTCGR